VRFLLAALVAAGALSAQTANPIRAVVGRLDLERYKTHIKGLAQFGDRMQGTPGNRDAIDWLEKQLRSFGYSNVERHRFLSSSGPLENIYATKVGTTTPGEMYIVSAHMDGRGGGEAADDDASGCAVVLELARVLGMPDVRTNRSVRFIFWNNEEFGMDGSGTYASERAALQATPGEPKWLGVIQHDMMMFDHGMPLPDGTMRKEQRAEADVNIEFQSNSKMAAESQKLAWIFEAANEKYATDYPAAVGPHMTNTDSGPFQDLIPAISLRENDRGVQIGNGWDPQWHQPTDVFSTYSDKDFRLGLNAAQTTLSAVAGLTGATLSK